MFTLVLFRWFAILGLTYKIRKLHKKSEKYSFFIDKASLHPYFFFSYLHPLFMVTEKIQVPVTPEEKQILQAGADGARRPLGRHVGWLALEAARRLQVNISPVLHVEDTEDSNDGDSGDTEVLPRVAVAAGGKLTQGVAV
jgi:hypothetical protein